MSLQRCHLTFEQQVFCFVVTHSFCHQALQCMLQPVCGPSAFFTIGSQSVGSSWRLPNPHVPKEGLSAHVGIVQSCRAVVLMDKMWQNRLWVEQKINARVMSRAGYENDGFWWRNPSLASFCQNNIGGCFSHLPKPHLY